MYPLLQLKKDEERRLLAGHLWIYSNEVNVVKTPLTAIEPGSLIKIESSRGKTLGIGYCNPHTLLCTRLLTRKIEPINTEFFQKRIEQALSLRTRLFEKPFYRLIYGDSDYLPGLIVDRYGEVLVVHFTTLGLWKQKDFIIEALQKVIHPDSLLIRTTATPGTEDGLPEAEEIIGNPIPDELLIEENNTKFWVNVKSGQKTGWFYDQRNNRAQMARYVKDKTVLDLFSYVGSFGIQAAVAGAKSVTCVDASAAAIQLLQKNAALNHVENKIKTEVSAVMDFLKQAQAEKKSFDVIIVDPPAYIKRKKDIPAGTEAYQRLNAIALSLLKPNGILITCSCSMHFSLSMLIDAVRKAAQTNKMSLQILSQNFQAEDHPFHPAIPETNYLKVLFCRVISTF